MERRVELADQALDYVLAHGLIGLSLRPLAAALGTSDRMLLYHFTSKERLVDAILQSAQRRVTSALGEPGPEVHQLGDLFRHLWASLTTPPAMAVTRLYLETCMLAAQNPQRWNHVPHQLRAPWRIPLRDGLIELGTPASEAPALADLVLGTLDGLALDRLTAADPARVDAAAEAFATLLSVRSSAPM